MVELYYTLVKEGRRTIEQVPERYKADVQAMLNAEGA
jgi:hypothetical protein